MRHGPGLVLAKSLGEERQEGKLRPENEGSAAFVRHNMDLRGR